jgi:SAM-dependent methyltransferase
VLAEPEILPFGDGRLDLIVSGLALQLANDLPGALVQMRRALRPDGLLLAAVLGGDSLMELRDAFVAAEAETTGGVSPRVLPVGDVGTLGGLLQRAGFAQPVVDSDRLVVSYPNPIALMHDLRLMGATNVLKARRRVPLRRDTLRRVGEIYQERYGRADGRIPATFEIITLTAWVPHDSQQKPLRPGSATARLADVLSTRELPLKR